MHVYMRVYAQYMHVYNVYTQRDVCTYWLLDHTGTDIFETLCAQFVES